VQEDDCLSREVEISVQEDGSVSAEKLRFPCKKLTLYQQGIGDGRASG
jgi:hypothetical protein